MANVTVEASSNIEAGNRCVVRTSSNFVYVLATSGTSLEMHKGNVAGEPSSFDTPVAVSSITGLQDIGGACAIDSGNTIHCIYYQIDTGHGGIIAVRYVTYNTSTDTFGTPETVATLDNDGSNHIKLGIAIDANDDPHVIWMDALTDMGTTTYTCWYSNKISGWATRVSVIGGTTTTGSTAHDIMIADPASSVNADRPIIFTGGSSLTQIDAHYGTALNATGFTSQSDITGSIGVNIAGTTNRVSCAIDSNEKITVAFSGLTTNDLMIVEHLNSSAWSSWQTPADVDTSTDYLSPSIAINGTDRYIFVEDSTNSDLNLWKDEGSGWGEETTDADLPNVGTFNDVKVKWSSKNNNTPTGLDYVFEDSSGNVLYNTISVATGNAITKITDEILDLVDSGIKVLGPVKSNAEILDLPETTATKRALTRIGNEILDLPETSVIKRALVRLKSETLDLPETANPLRSFTKIGNEILDLVEGGLRVLGIVKQSPEILDLPEVAVSKKTILKEGNEILDIPEGALQTRSLVRLKAEILDLPETPNYLRSRVRVVSEILDLPEGTVITRALIRLIAEFLDIPEDKVRIIGFPKISNEILDLPENGIKVLGIVKVDAEILDLSESSNKAIGLVKVDAEILDISETSAKVLGLVKTNAEILDIPEGSVITRALTRLKSEILDIPESAVSKITASVIIKIKNEILDLPENTVKALSMVRVLSEILDLPESSVVSRTLVRIKSAFLDLVESAIRKVIVPATSQRTKHVTAKGFSRNVNAQGFPRNVSGIGHIRGVRAIGKGDEIP